MKDTLGPTFSKRNKRNGRKNLTLDVLGMKELKVLPKSQNVYSHGLSTVSFIPRTPILVV